MASPTEDLTWQDYSACKDRDPDIFHPEAGQTELEMQAKGICAECRVGEACLFFALTKGEVFGIWGGKNWKERKLLAQNANTQEQ